jgi:hypothetical protein
MKEVWLTSRGSEDGRFLGGRGAPQRVPSPKWKPAVLAEREDAAGHRNPRHLAGG